MRRFRVAPALLVIGVVAAGALPGTVGAQGNHRPDLTVPKGSVRAADGVLQGSFVVSNEGRGRAGMSAARLVVRASAEDHLAGHFRVDSLQPSKSQKVAVEVGVPSDLPAGSWPIRACADGSGKIKEGAEGNNCRKVGKVDVGEVPPSSVPTDPIPFAENSVFTLKSPETRYWVYVPYSYDETHATPTKLLVWLHGCGGRASGDIYGVSPGGSQDWISIAVGGRERDCWNPNADQSKVLAAIADMKKHFNINPRIVIMGGYSSGGDLGYRTAFYNADLFAGLLVINSSPFRDTGSSQADSLAAASWKFNAVHLAHLQDDTYPIDGVRDETNAMLSAGFPLTRVEVEGTHYDPPGAIVNGHPVPGSYADIRTYLLPHIDDGWLSPP